MTIVLTARACFNAAAHQTLLDYPHIFGVKIQNLNGWDDANIVTVPRHLSLSNHTVLLPAQVKRIFQEDAIV